MSYDFSALRILVIDDNVHMHQILRSILSAMRISDVHFVVDLETAESEMSRWRPDVVVTDIAIGEDQGLEFVHRLRKGEIGFDPYLPVIVLTGYTERRMITRARDVGVHEVLAKPVSIENLYKRLVSIVVRPRPFIKASHYFGPCRRRQDKDFDGEDRRGQEPEDEMEIPQVSDFEAA